MHTPFRRSAIASAIAFICALSAAPVALAQTTDTPVLKEITVTGNPLGNTDLVTPVAQLSGLDLSLRAKATLGETLDGIPGVSSTYFGPNASRPIIRGQDGDRIRILQNGGASIDASALSYDHAVPVDTLVTDRIEVLRGPGALLYGGSAVGGVVNVIDSRIPTAPINGVTGRAELGAATGNRERGGGAMVEGGDDRFALHADVFDRTTGDVKVPASLGCENPSSLGFANRICNSASHAKGGAVGGTAFFDHGYLGASVSTYRSNYGTVAEDEVTIDMRSNRYALEGQLRNLGGPIASIKGQFSHSDYLHTEFDAGNPGTVFRNRSNDLRLEARQARLGNLDGVIGLQADSGRFSAVGDEAFVPFSRTRSTALFAHEELGMSWGKLSFGARTENIKVASFGNPDPTVTRFTPDSLGFKPKSAALGGLFNLSSAWQITTNLAYTERAPKDYELFANGPHLATVAWETGDRQLAKERSTSFDLGAAWKAGANRFALTGYLSRFQNYIGLVPTGDQLSADGQRNPPAAASPQTFPEYRYSGVRARFAGLEASGNIRLLGAQGLAQPASPSTVNLELRGDLVRATNTDTGEPLPRIAPARLGATLVWAQGSWGARGGFDHSTAQNRVPADGSRGTSAYTLWNTALTYRDKAMVGASATNLLWYARVDNITNKLAYSATSILTTTAFSKAPLPGRSLKVGLRADF